MDEQTTINALKKALEWIKDLIPAQQLLSVSYAMFQIDGGEAVRDAQFVLMDAFEVDIEDTASLVQMMNEISKVLIT